MKKTLLLFLLFLFVFAESCKDKDPKNNIDPNNNTDPKTEELVREHFTNYQVNDPQLPVALLIQNDSKTESIIVSGNRNKNNAIYQITSILAINTKIGGSIKLKLGKDYLIEEIEAISEGGRRVASFSNYNLGAGTVQIQIKDKQTNAIIAPNQQIVLGPEIVTNLLKLKQLYERDSKNARLKAETCTLLEAANLALGVAACITSIGVGVGIVVSCYVAIVGAPLFAIGTVLMCINRLGGDAVVTYITCKSAINDFEKKYEPCKENGEKELDKLRCFLTGWDDFPSYEEAKKKYEECEKQQEEKENEENTGGGWGDPHLTTTDGVYYDFQGFGEFILVKSTTDNFEIQARHEGPGNSEYATVTTALGIQTGDDIVSVHAKPAAVFINNEKQNITSGTISLKRGASISIQGGKIKVIASSKDRVEIDVYAGSMNYSLFLSPDRKGKVEGLLGNFDGNKENDLRTKEGEVVKNEFASLYPKYADSWRVNKNFLLHYESGKNTEGYTRRDLPKPLPTFNNSKRDAARKACMDAGVTGEPYLGNCTYDLLVTDNQDLIKGYVDLVANRPIDPSAPSNDEYAGAISIPINNNGYDCANTVSGTTNGATASAQASCSSIRKEDDVWFKFTATAAAHLLTISGVQAARGNSTYRNVQVFEAVNNAPGGNILCAEMTMEEKFLTGLKVGSTYFVRVSTWAENVRLNFKLCVSTPPVPPANDEYTGAIGLPINSGYNCANTVSGTTSGATASAQASCSSIRKEDDVWFKFTATAAAHLLTISGVQAAHGSSVYRNVQVFEAVNNAPGGNILCAEMTMEEKFLTGLKVGSTYFVRVSTWAENVRLNFKLCVSTPPVPPANDEYTGAIGLPINSGYNCANTVSGTTSGATASAQASCSSIRKEDDVWFKFTATAAAHLLTISGVQAAHGSSVYRNVQVFEAVNNAPGGNILCAEMTMEEKFLTGLKVGSTYFVRVSTWAENVRLNFKLCVSTPPVPPANDEYTGAIGLTMDTSPDCKSSTSGTTNGATASPQASCSSIRKEDDVWFKFTATAASHLLKISNIQAVHGSSVYRNVQVFEALNDAPGGNVLCAEMTMEQKALTGLKVGSTYFVRVSTWAENVRLDFKLCVSTN
ncbi:VWD domain-containing protein [Larkinella sp. GY13]|uniref:VWD domain-containing protein n=1 Tax=Larkinella sp. GY13 TaxID=3453720 RepID=UPI003EEECA51